MGLCALGQLSARPGQEGWGRTEGATLLGRVGVQGMATAMAATGGSPLQSSHVHTGCPSLCWHHFMQQSLGRGTVGSPGSKGGNRSTEGRSGLCKVTELRVVELGWLNLGPEPS